MIQTWNASEVWDLSNRYHQMSRADRRGKAQHVAELVRRERHFTAQKENVEGIVCAASRGTGEPHHACLERINGCELLFE